jgi:acrylyl-CoA reductase (NADPH)
MAAVNPESMRCLLVTKRNDGAIERAVVKRPTRELPEGDVVVRVQHSALNYKDALAATGHPGVVSHFPHVPGVDAAGEVVQSASSRFKVGDRVIVTSFELGAERWGGYAELIRVPAAWVVPLPPGLSPRESMILGTAGLTASLCLEAIERQDIGPGDGEVVVTGASGGVGTMAVSILAKAGYRVVAVSGKPVAAELLKRLGAADVVGREAVSDQSGKPLLKSRWKAAIDTVGGTMLSTILRSMQPGGCVAACGLVGGVEIPVTVYPFILRGVTLSGIDSAHYPSQKRPVIWAKLSGPWKPLLLDELVTEVALEDLEPKIADILAGQIIGRVVVKI